MLRAWQVECGSCNVWCVKGYGDWLPSGAEGLCFQCCEPRILNSEFRNTRPTSSKAMFQTVFLEKLSKDRLVPSYWVPQCLIDSFLIFCEVHSVSCFRSKDKHHQDNKYYCFLNEILVSCEHFWLIRKGHYRCAQSNFFHFKLLGWRPRLGNPWSATKFFSFFYFQMRCPVTNWRRRLTTRCSRRV